MEYQVVARRYRPQTFADLVGQEPIARALSNAIQGNRIGHAYLFTGARGVGKTSSARIFAKALNCVHGPTPTPCNVCEICQAISIGEDIDVLEIDGASNRGIEDIRTLRQNVNIRPIRSRFKIYIIDEVHMLTREAFNALLKTLEEPPEHVKFIFCTTEVGKIPITILSRCQRFDFAGIGTSEIAGRLAEIVASEGLTAEPAALDLIARRAAGSMRDGQSLLEQILAFVSEKITLADVHHLFGTVGEEVLLSLLRNMVERDAAAMLRTLDATLAQGGDPAALLEQLFGFLRDEMAMGVGCGAENLLFADGTHEETLRFYASRMGLETILAAMQILDHTLARMKVCTQVRLLAEMALVRLAVLGNLEDLGTLIAKMPSQTDSEPEERAAKNALPRPEQLASQSPSESLPSSPPVAPIVPPDGILRSFVSEEDSKPDSKPEPESKPEPGPVPEPTPEPVPEPTLSTEPIPEAHPEPNPEASLELNSTTPEAALQQAFRVLAENGEKPDEMDILAQFEEIEISQETKKTYWTVHYEARHLFLVSLRNTPKFLKQLEQVLKSIWKQPVRVRLHAEEKLDESLFLDPNEERKIVREHPLIRKVEDVMDAYVQDVERLSTQTE